jgi:uncharacterized protein
MAEKQYQPHFMIIPSLSCPAACSYCFGPNIGPTMDADMVRQVVSFVEKMAIETHQEKVDITFHGGEPLCSGYDIIALLVSQLRDKFCSLSINMQSNLWLLDDRFCELFSKYHVSIGTSLDGPKWLNDAQRGEGYFDKTMNGIRLAAKHGIRVGCIATFTSRTMRHWREVFDFFLENNINFSIHPSVATMEKTTDLAITPEAYALLLKEMFECYMDHDKDIDIATFNQYCRGVALGAGHVCTFKDCFGMFLAIDPCGDIFSCQRFAGKRSFRMGNVKNSPTFEELQSSAAAQRILQRETEIQDACGSCEHYSYCRGGCLYNAWSQGQQRDPYCEAYKAFYTHIKDALYHEMISEKNADAIARYGPAETGNPLYRRGRVIELAKRNAHPYQVSRNAKRIIAAYELGKNQDTAAVAKKLVSNGVSKTYDSAKISVDNLKNQLEADKPLYKLYLHISWNCQLMCTHCYAANNPPEDIPLKDILKIALDVKECGFKEIVVTGGEPLMYPNRAELLRSFAGIRGTIKPVTIVLRTNFSMPLKDEDFLLISDAFDEVVISMDGDEQAHDARRGQGVYQKLTDNIKRYMDWRDGRKDTALPALSLSASLTCADVTGSLGASIKETAAALGISHVKFRPLLPLGNAQRIQKPLSIEPFKGYISPMDLVEGGFRPVASCGMGQNLYVEPSGEAFPCYAYHKPHAFLGNVVARGLRGVIEDEAFISLRRHNVDTNALCKGCEYRYLCGGACRAWSGEKTQYDFDAAPVYCEPLKKRAESLYHFAVDYLAMEAEGDAKVNDINHGTLD